jgi:hypothetical protein
MSADMKPSMRENIATAPAENQLNALGLAPRPAVNKRLSSCRAIAALPPKDFPARRKWLGIDCTRGCRMTRTIALGMAFSSLRLQPGHARRDGRLAGCRGRGRCRGGRGRQAGNRCADRRWCRRTRWGAHGSVTGRVSCQAGARVSGNRASGRRSTPPAPPPLCPRPAPAERAPVRRSRCR